jgi:hypothetical protein
MKISTPGKYIVETVGNVRYDPYHDSHVQLSGRRFFGFPYGHPFLAHKLLKHQVFLP